MPELPEVECVARGMHKKLRGAVIDAVWRSDKRLRNSSPAEALESALVGAKIARVERRGKQVVVVLQERDGRARADWRIHLGMTGRVSITHAADEPLKHTHLIAALADGRELRYSDPRRFGALEVLPPGEALAPGREPLTIDFADFYALFHPRRAPIKAALLDQALLSGVGNIYADESLFRAGVRPTRAAAKLTRAVLERLHKAVQQTLAAAIDAGGSSVSDYVDADGKHGFFQLEHRVYQRTGEPCLACGAKIARVAIGGRSTHYCPKCQK